MPKAFDADALVQELIALGTEAKDNTAILDQVQTSLENVTSNDEQAAIVEGLGQLEELGSNPFEDD
jgi:hypothetical protein